MYFKMYSNDNNDDDYVIDDCLLKYAAMIRMMMMMMMMMLMMMMVMIKSLGSAAVWQKNCILAGKPDNSNAQRCKLVITIYTISLKRKKDIKVGFVTTRM